jgi:hypothetical protein
VPSAGRLVNLKRRTSLGVMLRFIRRAGPLVLLLLSTPVAAQRSARRVIDARAIAAAGWHRLGDIVSALPPGAVASVDGFNSEISGSRLGFQEASGIRAMWMVRLDGQPMPMQLDGMWLLDLLPVAITQLDSVVVTEGPRLVDGRAAVLGTIDLHTRRPRRLSLIADYQHGDESGDPGPYRYTARTTPNVEKLGPFASVTAAIGAGVGAIDVAARRNSLNTTDDRLTANLTTPLGRQDVNAAGGSAVMTFEAGGGSHYVVAGRARFSGLMRDPAIGALEWPKIFASHAGVSGSFAMGERFLRYSAAATALDVDQLTDAIPLTIGQERLIGDAFIEAPVSRHFTAGAGMNVGRQDVDVEARERRAARGWLGFSDARGAAVAAVEHSLGGLSISGSARHERTLPDSDVVAVSLNLLTSWTDADNAWMDGFGSAGSHEGRTAAADIRAEISTGELLRLHPTWYVRGFRFAGFRAAANGAASDSSFAARQGVAAGFVVSSSSAARVRLWGRGEISQLIGDAGRGEASLPAGFAEGSATTTTAGNFALALSARFAPATRWPVDATNPESALPSTRRIDFSVNKSVWQDRVRAQLVIRNLLNAAERSHPLGAQWNFRSHLAVTIALPSGASAR